MTELVIIDVIIQTLSIDLELFILLINAWLLKSMKWLNNYNQYEKYCAEKKCPKSCESKV